MSSVPIQRLEYFAGHGRAIEIRMALFYCGVDYENHLLSANKKEFDNSKYTYKQVPALFLLNGKQLTQSSSILRYIGS